MTKLNNNPLRSSLLPVLWDIQRKRRFISVDDMTKIAREFRMSRIELEGVISFYHFLHTKHAGQYTIYLNNAIVSKHMDYLKVKKAFEKELGIQMGQVTPDRKFGLFETSCIGLSDKESAALINFYPFTGLTPEKVKDIIEKIRQEVPLNSIADVPDDNIQYLPAEDRTVFLKSYEPAKGLKKMIGMSPNELIELLKKSKLSGRGGAFFPTGLKWEICKSFESDQKYIICNADEGEPGTFKDRVLLNSYPGLFLEGMAMAGYAVGADKGYIYLRAEYAYLKDKIERCIAQFKEKGWLGKNILGVEDFHFDVHIYMGAGAYVCGEETALIASMEGRRGEPSTKEYFPVERGFLDKPTIVNNVETLCAVPRILEMGLERFLELGTPATPGTKLISISGDCERPGLYEIEWGMKLRELLDLAEAEDPYLVLLNGYAGESLSAADFDRELSGENLLEEHVQFQFEDPIIYAEKMSGIGLRSGGSLMTFNKDRDLMEIYKNVADFFVAESCGICAPCRTGNFLLNKKLAKVKLCRADQNDLQELKQWSKIIKQSSRCGLGKTSTSALLTGMLKFPDAFTTCLLANSDINESFDEKKVVAEYESIIREIELSNE